MDEERQGLFGRLQQMLRRLIAAQSWPSGNGDPDDDDGDALVGAPIRPRTPLRSGAVALAEPDDADSAREDVYPVQAFPPSSRPTIPSKIRVAQSAQTD
jgi:hypothetical protein